MNQTPEVWDQIAGQWKQFEGEIRTHWDKFTIDEVEQICGQRDRLIGLLKERYGITRNDASRQVENWEQRYRL